MKSREARCWHSELLHRVWMRPRAVCHSRRDRSVTGTIWAQRMAQLGAVMQQKQIPVCLYCIVHPDCHSLFIFLAVPMR